LENGLERLAGETEHDARFLKPTDGVYRRFVRYGNIGTTKAGREIAASTHTASALQARHTKTTPKPPK